MTARAHATPPSGNPRLQGDGGSVIVELALVVPILVICLLGIFEYGTAWRNSTILASSLRTTVRTVAQAKQSELSDVSALQTFAAAIGNGEQVTVDKVIIYKSSTTGDGKPSTACMQATPVSAPAGCNVYDATRLLPANLVASNFGTASGCAGKYDEKWCPKDRKNSLITPGPDVAGVWVQLTYTSMTGLLPQTIKVTDYSTSRIEP